MIFSLKSLYHSGYSEKNKDSTNQEIYVANSLVLLQTPFCLIGGVAEYFNNHPTGVLSFALLFFATISVLFLNKIKYYLSAKLIIVIAPVLIIYYTVYYFDSLRLAYYITFPMVLIILGSVSALLFTAPKHKYLGYFIYIMLGGLLIGNSFIMDSFFDISFIKDTLKGSPFIVSFLFFTAFTLNVAVYLFFNHISQKHKNIEQNLNEELSSKNGLLEEQKVALESTIKELTLTQVNLEKSQKKVENLLASVKKGNIVISYDLDGEAVEVNEKLLRLLGTPVLNFEIKQNLNLKSWMSDLEFYTFVDALKDGSIVHKNIDIIQDGTFHSLNLTFSPVNNKKNELIKILAIGKDQSEIVKNQQNQ